VAVRSRDRHQSREPFEPYKEREAARLANSSELDGGESV